MRTGLRRGFRWRIPRLPEAPSAAYGAGLALLAISVVVRCVSYPVVTSDYQLFLAPWFATLQRHPGFTAFAQPFSDYAPLYLYGLKLLTFIPVPSLVSIKTLSLLFDLVIAGIAVRMIHTTTPRRETRGRLFLVFAVMVSIPTVVVNSSLWGQIDAFYAAGIVACLYWLLSDRPLPAITAFGVALCVKLQTVFFLPVLIGYLLRRWRDLWQLAIIPGLFMLSVVPAWLGGGSLPDLLTVYLRQAGEYPALTMYAPTIFAFVEAPQTAAAHGRLAWGGTLLAGLAALGVIALTYASRERSPRQLVLLSLLSVVAVPYVLPHMHERYFYLADVISVLYVWYRPQAWYLPVIILTVSLFAYLPYLTEAMPVLERFLVDLRLLSVSLMAALGLIMVTLLAGPEEDRAEDGP